MRTQLFSVMTALSLALPAGAAAYMSPGEVFPNLPVETVTPGNANTYPAPAEPTPVIQEPTPAEMPQEPAMQQYAVPTETSLPSINGTQEDTIVPSAPAEENIADAIEVNAVRANPITEHMGLIVAIALGIAAVIGAYAYAKNRDAGASF